MPDPLVRLSRTDRCRLIDEWIFNSKYREIMKGKLLDGLTHEQLAEQYDLSVRQIANIVKKYKHILACHIDERI